MLVSFTQSITDADLDQFLQDIEQSMMQTGVVKDVTKARHVPVEGEEQIPAFIATAVLTFTVESREDLAALFSAPGAIEVIHKWKADHPYQVAWVNSEAHE
ncbi:hypothetical protein JSO19_10345 [Leucobacter sp. UCMA 4100]|uniref:hypothetical protein n=1 Tax=Leucobacter sp. UCMA 4100 TaxID=2810534 RepID=UPI0022EAC284|nr:hypothetical protein [Leucobacter sp. UCMA 4100]MDA3147777.1 hypothetical protein [Leucobacter sp. UCMA 4100]